MAAAPVFKITPTIQQYDWGKVGKSSKVAQLAESSNLPGFTLKEAQPYAELWMGTHPKSPSLVPSTNRNLSEHLKANPSLIGQKIITDFTGAGDGNIPFLFKVLSIQKALSIQTHPDKKTAEELHAKQPDIYKDPNHKPEMTIALTDFRALCGFRPLHEIAAHLKAVPELASLIPPLILERFLHLSSTSSTSGLPASPEAKQALKDVFSAIMTADPSAIKRSLKSLSTKASGPGSATDDVSKDVLDLVVTLNTQFPGDVGALCPLLLNDVTLKPGEAIFLGAGEPHAYIEGDVMEAMANSDNVIRAGLTPKLRDIPNLVSCLTYTPAPHSEHVVKPALFPDTKQPHSDERSAKSLLYDPLIPEFSVIQVKLSPDEEERHPALDGPSIFIVTTGSGRIVWNQGPGEETGSLDVGLGDVVFIGAGTGVEFITDRKSRDGIILYRAFVQVP
ncbi:mannose-6-phosphate isomerase [Amanita muscaria]